MTTASYKNTYLLYKREKQQSQYKIWILIGFIAVKFYRKVIKDKITIIDN